MDVLLQDFISIAKKKYTFLKKYIAWLIDILFQKATEWASTHH